MPIAALYDIHGNLPALDAVLRDVRDAGVDRIVVGGDVVPGPMSSATLQRLLDLEVPIDFIHGNCEMAVLAEHWGTEAPAWYRRLPDDIKTVVRWQAQELRERDFQIMAEWQRTLALDLPGLGRVLFCHATPRDENELFTRLTAEDKLLPVFSGLDAALVVCGHTHMQFDRRVGDVRVVNAGSVGMPFGLRGAFWLLLGPDVQLRRTDYDLDAAAGQIRGTDYPQAEAFAAGLIDPPSEEATLASFAQTELEPG